MLRCIPCNRDFPNRRALEQHLLASSRHHYCLTCQRDFDTQDGLMGHELAEHYLSDPDSLSELGDVAIRMVSSEGSQWSSDYGDNSEFDSEDGDRRPRSHTGTLSSSGYSDRSEAMEVHQFSGSSARSGPPSEASVDSQDDGHDGRYCRACQTQFPTVEAIRSHMEQSSRHPWWCSRCTVELSGQQAFRRHMERHGVDTTPRALEDAVTTTPRAAGPIGSEPASPPVSLQGRGLNLMSVARAFLRRSERTNPSIIAPAQLPPDTTPPMPQSRSALVPPQAGPVYNPTQPSPPGHSHNPSPFGEREIRLRSIPGAWTFSPRVSAELEASPSRPPRTPTSLPSSMPTSMTVPPPTIAFPHATELQTFSTELQAMSAVPDGRPLPRAPPGRLLSQAQDGVDAHPIADVLPSFTLPSRATFAANPAARPFMSTFAPNLSHSGAVAAGSPSRRSSPILYGVDSPVLDGTLSPISVSSPVLATIGHSPDLPSAIPGPYITPGLPSPPPYVPFSFDFDAPLASPSHATSVAAYIAAQASQPLAEPPIIPRVSRPRSRRPREEPSPLWRDSAVDPSTPRLRLQVQHRPRLVSSDSWASWAANVGPRVPNYRRGEGDQRGDDRDGEVFSDATEGWDVRYEPRASGSRMLLSSSLYNQRGLLAAAIGAGRPTSTSPSPPSFLTTSHLPPSSRIRTATSPPPRRSSPTTMPSSADVPLFRRVSPTRTSYPARRMSGGRPSSPHPRGHMRPSQVVDEQPRTAPTPSASGGRGRHRALSAGHASGGESTVESSRSVRRSTRPLSAGDGRGPFGRPSSPHPNAIAIGTQLVDAQFTGERRRRRLAQRAPSDTSSSEPLPHHGRTSRSRSPRPRPPLPAYARPSSPPVAAVTRGFALGRPTSPTTPSQRWPPNRSLGSVLLDHELEGSHPLQDEQRLRIQPHRSSSESWSLTGAFTQANDDSQDVDRGRSRARELDIHSGPHIVEVWRSSLRASTPTPPPPPTVSPAPAPDTHAETPSSPVTEPASEQSLPSVPTWQQLSMVTTGGALPPPELVAQMTAAALADAAPPPPPHPPTPEDPAGPQVICPLCLDPARVLTSTRCGHVFCQECILLAVSVKKECPVCRKYAREGTLHLLFLNF